MYRPETGRLLENLPYGISTLDHLWIILSEVATVPPGEQRRMLRAMLDALVEAGEIELPKLQKGWDRSALPHLPLKVTRRRPRTPAREYASVIWSPELGFLSERKEPVDSPWLQIDDWLKHTRHFPREPVPVRERSLEIFGDEKALDSLLMTRPFRCGLISLATLSCYYVPEPPAWERGPLSRAHLPGLCIENSTTYHVISRFNKEAGLWGFVVYGRGSGFAAAVEGIIPIMEEYGHARIRYFGDLDLEGMEIAARGAKQMKAGGKELELDARLYRLVLETGKQAPSRTGGALSPGAAELIDMAGLGELRRFFDQHLRIAQEWAGYRKLKERLL